MTRKSSIAVLLVCAAAIVPYLSTLNGYFVRDDFGVVQLLASKPAGYFPRWFVSSWMDRIWGYLPDEVRPFPAVSYQLTALGGAASPFLHHVLNILIHAVNALLVVALARTAARLSLVAAAFAGIVFALLPVQVESVAWITGRVDSMPALFYLATFLAYVRWRQGGTAGVYAGSLVLFFVALFTKQNTITMVGTLAAYDVIVERRPLLPAFAFIRPYLPFAVMTAAYLYLRHLLFGEVVREGTLNARGLHDFWIIVARHIRHIVIGSEDGSQVFVWLAALGFVVIWFAAQRVRSDSAQSRREVIEGPGARPPSPDRSSAIADTRRSLIYFGPVWWTIGIAPILVAGYSSPRHVYLAAVGWAIVIAIAFEIFWTSKSSTVMRRAAFAVATVVVIVYTTGLIREVHEYNLSAAVSQKVVRDIRGLALASQAGTLLIVGAPGRSWEWALPFAVRPPFVRTDLTERVYIISPRALVCCTAAWFDETRRTLNAWSASGSRDLAVALKWDRDSGALSKTTTGENPQLPVLIRALLAMKTPEDLDRNLVRMIDVLTVPTP